MIRHLVREDLAWAGFILAVAALFGIAQHWPLVRTAVTGDLKPLLEKTRAQQRQREFQGVKTVSLPQAYALWQGKALFIDARKPEEYADLHIAGAVNLPPETLEKDGGQAVAQIAKDREMVVYCGEASCNAALKVAEKLQTMGYTRVAAFLGGFHLWDEAGYPADTSK